MGALISSVNCSFNCKNCFNQELKSYETLSSDSEDIIRIIKQNPFNQGIILAGLEWTEQPDEMVELIQEAVINDLEVALYTGMEEDEFKERFPQVHWLPIYIKFGRYDESKNTDKNIQYGVKLASSNQYFYKGEYRA